ncbi:MAG: hypothetical protein ACRELA_14805, partial [Candidatus Rokuibacteriota bacterium]
LGQAYAIQTLAVFWVPWLLLALERFLSRPTWVAAGTAASLWLALAFSGLNVFVYANVAAGVLIGSATVWGGRHVGRAHLVRVATVGAPAAALLIAYLTPFRMLAREWRLGRTLVEVEQHAASFGDYLGILRGPRLDGLWGVARDTSPESWPLLSGFTVTALVMIGLGAILRRGSRLRPALLPYIAMAGVTGILALGPTLRTPWGPVPLPYRALYEAVPGFNAIRTAGRFLLFVGLALALLAAAGAAHLIGRLEVPRRRIAAGGLVGLILVESVVVPFPGALQRLDPAEIPEVYRWLAAQDARTLTIELPMQYDWKRVGIAAFHLRPTVNGFSSFMPPHYHGLATAMNAFPDARSVALLHGLRPDVVLVDRRWLDLAREAALDQLDDTFKMERIIGDHVVYRLRSPSGPGIDQLRARAVLVPQREGQAALGCVLLANPGPGFVPLYPLRQLRLEVDGGPAAMVTAAGRWLPLDLAPGAAHVECLELPRPLASIRVRGEVTGGGHAHRFAAVSGAPPEPLVPGAR